MKWTCYFLLFNSTYRKCTKSFNKHLGECLCFFFKIPFPSFICTHFNSAVDPVDMFKNLGLLLTYYLLTSACYVCFKVLKQLEIKKLKVIFYIILLFILKYFLIVFFYKYIIKNTLDLVKKTKSKHIPLFLQIIIPILRNYFGSITNVDWYKKFI